MNQKTTMEKSSNNYNKYCLKDENNGGRSATNGIIKDHPYSWGNNVSDEDSLGGDKDLVGGLSWPPRSYTCTFCKREFRSAQALGGHMNVHRRDRARLRQMPFSTQNLSSNYTLLNLDPNPNPNPNFFSSKFSSTQTIFPSFTSTSMLPPLISPSPSSPKPNMPYGLTMMKSQIPSFGVHGFRNGNENKIVNKSEIIRLNLEIGLLGESKSDDLDLELRLGVS